MPVVSVTGVHGVHGMKGREDSKVMNGPHQREHVVTAQSAHKGGVTLTAEVRYRLSLKLCRRI